MRGTNIHDTEVPEEEETETEIGGGKKCIWRNNGRKPPKFGEKYKFVDPRNTAKFRWINLKKIIGRHITIKLLKDKK